MILQKDSDADENYFIKMMVIVKLFYKKPVMVMKCNLHKDSDGYEKHFIKRWW